MSNESILLGAIKQTSLEEYVLILPNKRDGWEQTASGASTPTLSVGINYFLNEFCFSRRHQMKKNIFYCAIQYKWSKWTTYSLFTERK